MEELGNTLKRRRIELGYTIEEISKKTSLSVKHIRQLETGDLTSFKEDLTYIPFYFKNYCKILNIDYNEIKSKLDDSIQSYTTALKLDEINKKREIENSIRKTVGIKQKNTTNLNYGFISFIVVIVGIICVVSIGLFYMFKQEKQETTLPQQVEVVQPTPQVIEERPKVIEKTEIKMINSTTYEVKIKSEKNFKIVLGSDSWMSFNGSSNPISEKVYKKGENPTIKVNPNEKIVVRMGVLNKNYFVIDEEKIQFETNLKQPQTFEIKFVGE